MNYDDKLKIVENNSGRPVASSEAIERIKLYFPEYAEPGATVTTEFIRIVDAVTDDDFDLEEYIYTDVFSEAQLRHILGWLTDKQIAEPLQEVTIEKIMHAIYSCLYNQDFESDLFMECEDAFSYSSRGQAKMELGLYEEALQDYEQACRLEPENGAYLIYRAEIFHKLGDCEQALQEGVRAFDMTGDIFPDNPGKLTDMLQLFLFFDDLKNPKMTARVLLRYIETLNAFLPLIAIQEDGSFEIEKEDQSHSSDIGHFELYIGTIREMEELGEKDIELDMLLGRLKDEICRFRSRVGF